MSSAAPTKKAAAAASTTANAAASSATSKLGFQSKLLAARKALLRKQQAKAAAQQKQQARLRDDNDEDDNDDESSGSDSEESDSEIGMMADENVKATMKPISESATAASSTKQQSKSKKQGQKRKAQSAASGDDDDDGDDTNSDPNELIDVEFGLYDAKPADYLTLKALLRDYVIPTTTAAAAKKKKKKVAAAKDDSDEEGGDETAAAPSPDADFALHELCDAIVTQASVGSMIKGEGTEEPLGFASALSLKWQETYAKSEVTGEKVVWVDQFRSYLIGRAPANLKAQFTSALNHASTGLLIQARLINVPPQIIPALHSSLQQDIEWTTENTGPYGKFFSFAQVILIARKFKPAPGSKKSVRQDVVLKNGAEQFVSPFASKKKQKLAARAQAAAANTSSSSAADSSSTTSQEYEWLRFEEEIYSRHATSQFTFACPFTAEDAAAGRQPQQCVVMIIPQKAMQAIVQELAAMV